MCPASAWPRMAPTREGEAVNAGRPAMSIDPIRRIRIRYILVLIILGTLPCYCAGLFAVQFAPEVRPTETPTPPVPFTTTPSPSPAAVLPATLTPQGVIITLSPIPSRTPTPSPTTVLSPTISPTAFQPRTGTPTPTLTSTPTDTSTPTQTATSTHTPTWTATATLTAIQEATATASLTITLTITTNWPTLTPVTPSSPGAIAP